MVKNWKEITGVLVGILLIMVLVVIGLLRISKEKGLGLSELTEGASWVTEKGEIKVTVVEFSDLQCPACREAEKIARSLRQTEGVRFVFRHLPLTMIHKNSRKAAEVVEATRSMGKGWEMMEVLFDKQEKWGSLNEDEFKTMVGDYVNDLGLDREEFERILGLSEIEEQIKLDEEVARRLMINGTPTFFVNGNLVVSNLVLNEVDKLLKK